MAKLKRKISKKQRKFMIDVMNQRFTVWEIDELIERCQRESEEYFQGLSDLKLRAEFDMLKDSYEFRWDDFKKAVKNA